MKIGRKTNITLTTKDPLFPPKIDQGLIMAGPVSIKRTWLTHQYPIDGHSPRKGGDGKCSSGDL